MPDKIQQLEDLIHNTCPELAFADSYPDCYHEIHIDHILRTANARGKFLAIDENGHFWCRVRNEEFGNNGDYDLSKSYQEQKKSVKELLANIIV